MINTSIICEKRHYNETVTSHYHEHGQFLFPLQGSMELKTGSQTINLTPDHCFYLAPYSDHDFRSVNQNEFLVLDIPERILPGNTSDMYEEMNDSWTAVTYLLLQEINNTGHSDALGNLTSYISHKIKTMTPSSIEYINKNYKQRLSLETLAAIENYHPSYYSKWFKNQTGKSVKDYINELRLNETKSMLLSTSWSITRIAGDMDFDNLSSFTRWFVKNESVSPNVYRALKK